MKEHQKRDILIISSVLVVVLLAVLLLNRDKPFSIFSSGDQAKQVTNAYLQQTDQLEPDFTPNPNEAIALSTDSTLAAVSQPTSTQQSSELETATYLPSDTQALAASATGTTPTSIVATNTRPLSATSTKASTATQATQSVSTSYPVPTSQTASTNTPFPTNQSASTSYPVPTYEPIVTHTPSSEPTSTVTATSKPSDTPTATLTPTNTSTPSFTPTTAVQTGWEGDWTVWFQQADGNYISGDITINLNGTNLTGSGTLAGVNYTFEGFAPNNFTADGTWASPSSSGSFIWNLFPEEQFNGSRDYQFGFCGARPGSDQPAPCYVPSIS